MLAETWQPWAGGGAAVALASLVVGLVVRGLLVPRRTVRDLLESAKDRTTEAERREEKWERAYFDLLGISERATDAAEHLARERAAARGRPDDVVEQVRSLIRDAARDLAPEEKRR